MHPARVAPHQIAQGAGCFQFAEYSAGEEGGMPFSPVVYRDDDSVHLFAMACDELRHSFGRNQGMIAEGDHNAADSRWESIAPDADRGGHIAVRVGSACHGNRIGSCRLCHGITLGTDYHDYVFDPSSQQGPQATINNRLAVKGQQLLAGSHSTRLPGCQQQRCHVRFHGFSFPGQAGP